MKIDRLDHLVLTVRSIEATCAFYGRVLGTQVVPFGEGRTALAFGASKINLHEAGRELEPRANRPTPGSADFCLIADGPIENVLAHLRERRVSVLEGPVAKTGALGAMISVYFRDPDLNLVEIAVYAAQPR